MSMEDFDGKILTVKGQHLVRIAGKAGNATPDSPRQPFPNRAIQIHRVTQLLLLDVFAFGVGDVD